MPYRIRGAASSTDRENLGNASGAYAHAEGLNSKATAGYGAHAEGADTTASGDSSHSEGDATTASGAGAHSEGWSTTASGNQAHAEGSQSVASGQGAHAQGGGVCTASGNWSHAEGHGSVAAGIYARAEGRQSSAARYAQQARAGGMFAAAGDAQACRYVARVQTTTATTTNMYFDGGASAVLTGASANVLTIPVNRAYLFEVRIVARRSDSPEMMAGWRIRNLVVRNTANSAWFPVGNTVEEWDVDAAAWSAAVTVNSNDATNNYLQIAVTGAASTTIRWVAAIDTVEVG